MLEFLKPNSHSTGGEEKGYRSLCVSRHVLPESFDDKVSVSVVKYEIGLVKYEIGYSPEESYGPYSPSLATREGVSMRKEPIGPETVTGTIVIKPYKTNLVVAIVGPIIAFVSWLLFRLPKSGVGTWYLNQLLLSLTLASFGLWLTAVVSLIEGKRRQNR